MTKHTGTFKSEKRKKELLRQKKQEEKRLKRLGKDTDSKRVFEVPGQEGQRRDEEESEFIKAAAQGLVDLEKGREVSLEDVKKRPAIK